MIFLSHSIPNMSKWWFSVNIQQWHDMTCAEYNEYILLLSTFWIKMFDVIHFCIPWNVFLVPVTSQWTEKKLLEKNTSYLICDSVLQIQQSWNKKWIYRYAVLPDFFFFFEKRRIFLSCPSRFRFRTSPYCLMVVLRTSWGKNKCRALF